jgi:predicted transcriptional regulator
MANITIRTNDEIAEKIGDLAKAMDRPKNWVIEDALKKYIAEQAWQIKGIKQAQKSLELGNAIAFDPVINKLRSKIRKKR